MKDKIYVIKDQKAGFMNPFLQPNELVAIRNFSQTCKDESTNLAKYPEDYSLWEIGEFNHDTGEIVGYKKLQKLASAITYVPANMNA